MSGGFTPKQAYTLPFSVLLDTFLNEMAYLIQCHMVGRFQVDGTVATGTVEVAGVGDINLDAVMIGLVLSAKNTRYTRTDAPHRQRSSQYLFPQVVLEGVWQ